MTTKRRQFLKTFATLSGGALLSPWLQPLGAQTSSRLAAYEHFSPEDLATNEEFWGIVRQAFSSSPNIINLNSGGVSPHPRQVQEAVTAYNRHANEVPAYYMWREMGRQRIHMIEKLAALAGTTDEEIALVRNTTEAINTVLLGMDWQKGDEIVTSDQVYPAMEHALLQLENRHGIRVVKLPLPVPASDQASLIAPFEKAISRKTRLVLICHVINLSGQIMPVKEVAEIAHQRGAEVLVDGAHSFAHIDFKIPELGVDYFASSLHKWLCAPFGTGLLYVKKEKIPQIWPLYAAPHGQEDSIRKFEHLGTRSVPIELAVSHAIDFHKWIGAERKQARLHHLKNLWAEKAQELPRIFLSTNLAPDHSCAIANFSIEGEDMTKMGNTFLREHSLYTTVTNHKDVKGIRISPNVFTLAEEMEYLLEVIEKYAK